MSKKTKLQILREIQKRLEDTPIEEQVKNLLRALTHCPKCDSEVKLFDEVCEKCGEELMLNAKH